MSERAHVAETIRGGIATYLREVIALQVQRYGENRVAVIAPTEQLADLGQLSGALLLGVDRTRSRLRTAWRVRRRLDSLLAGKSTEILHVHSAFAGMTCRIKPPRQGGLVYCPHGWAFTRQARGGRLAARIERSLSRQCDAIVCVSAAETQAAAKYRLPRQKLATIYNGLPDRVLPETPDNDMSGSPLRILFAGRLDRQKGFDVLLAALNRLEREIEIHVFGESVLGEYAVADLPDTVHMHGWQTFEVIEPFLSQCDALVMPSRWDAFGLSAIEAMRAGKPVIASDVGGLVELIEDRVTGYLVPPGDAHALAEVLELAQPGELALMGRRGRERFLERFRIEKCESDLAALYKSVNTRSMAS